MKGKHSLHVGTIISSPFLNNMVNKLPKKNEFQQARELIRKSEFEFLFSNRKKVLGWLESYVLTHTETNVFKTIATKQSAYHLLHPAAPDTFKPEGMPDDVFDTSFNALAQLGIVSVEIGGFININTHNIFQILLDILYKEDEEQRLITGDNIRRSHGLATESSGYNWHKFITAVLPEKQEKMTIADILNSL